MRIVDNFTNEYTAKDEFFTICNCGKFLIVDKILDKIIENDEEFFRCCECRYEFTFLED